MEFHTIMKRKTNNTTLSKQLQNPIERAQNSNQQNQSYKFTSHITVFLSVVLSTEMLEICMQTSYDQNVQLILKSYLPVVLGTTLIG